MRWEMSIPLLILLCLCGCYDIHKDELGYYENGTLYLWSGGSGDGEMVDGKKEGFWTLRDSSRNMTSQGRFEADVMAGDWSFYYADGAVQSKGPFVKDLPNGTWSYFFNNGALASSGNMKEGARDGDWRFYFANGDVMSQGAFTAGKRVETWAFFYQGGGPKETRLYKNEQNLLIRSFSPEGTPMVVDGTGPYTYIDNGFIREKGAYQDSLPVGEWEYYDAQGNFVEKKTFEAAEANP